MQTTAIILIVISALTHAGWNLLGKHEHPSAGFFFIACTSGTLCLLPVLVVHGRFLVHIPQPVWRLLGLAGFFQAAYCVGLAGAYRNGEISVAYPLARSSPLVVVFIVTLFFGRGSQISVQCAAGVLLIVAGCFFLPMKRFGEFRLSNYWNLSCLYALGAAFATAGYSIIDDEALRILRDSREFLNAPHQITVLYLSLEGLLGSTWLGLFVLCRKRERVLLHDVLQNHLRNAILAGIGIYATYSLVLVSMAFAANVTYVVAFRQLSIPIGAVLGAFMFNEARNLPKFAGVAIMFMGLMLVGTG